MNVGGATIDLGGISVTMLRAGSLRLDGGAMFGLIPRPLWERTTPADERHRIQLACNSLLIEWQDPSARRVVVETGHGEKFSPKEQDIYAIDPARWLGPVLRAHGVDPETVTDVVVTHLHFDHAGGLTRLDGERAVPTFPKARVHVQRREFDDARANFGIMTNTYREANFEPIDRIDGWRLLDGPGEILPGVSAILTPGHTRGHQSIRVTGRDRTLIYTGDVMPTAAHGGAPYNMGYDLFPLDNRESKRRMLAQAADEGALIVLDHEPGNPVMQSERDGDWYRISPAASL